MEGAAHGLVAPEGERQVGDATANLATRAESLDFARSVDEVNSVVVVLFHTSTNRQNIRIKDDVLRVETNLLHQELVSAAADAHLFSLGGRLTLLIERHHDDSGAVTLHNSRVTQEFLFTTLEGNGVHDALALAALQASLDDVELGGVNHERHLGSIRLGHKQVHEASHGGFAVNETIVHVDINHVRTVLDLLEGNGESLVEVTVNDRLLENDRAGDVTTLTKVDERLAVVLLVRLVVERLETRDTHDVRHIVLLAGRVRSNHVGERANVVIRRTAAPTDGVQKSLLEEDAALFRHFRTLLIVTTHGVRQTSVGVRENPAVGTLAQVLNVRHHILRAEGAVQTDSHRLRVAHRVPERFVRLSRQRTTGVINNRTGDEQRKARTVGIKEFLNGKNSGLGVERIEDRLHQEDVNTTLNERFDLLIVRIDNLIERARAEGRVLNRRRHGQRSVCRANGTGGETRLARILLGELLARCLREASRGQVHVANFFLLVQLVVRLRNHRRGERVRLDDVGAGGEVRFVDLRDDFRLRQHQHIIVAFQVMGVILVTRTSEVILAELVLLHSRTHGAVDDHHAFPHDTLDDVKRRGLFERIVVRRVLGHRGTIRLRFHRRILLVVPGFISVPLHHRLLHLVHIQRTQRERRHRGDRRQDGREHHEERGAERENEKPEHRTERAFTSIFSRRVVPSRVRQPRALEVDHLARERQPRDGCHRDPILARRLSRSRRRREGERAVRTRGSNGWKFDATRSRRPRSRHRTACEERGAIRAAVGCARARGRGRVVRIGRCGGLLLES